MSTDRDTTRIVRSWLTDGVDELPDHVLDSVLDQLPATAQTPARGWPAWRFVMSSSLRWGAAAAVVAALAIVGVIYFQGGTGIGGVTPPPSVSPSGTPSPTPLPSGTLPTSGDILPGSYTVSDPFPVDVTFEVGPGWSMWSSGVGPDTVAVYEDSFDPPAGHGIGFLIVDNVYADPCQPSAGPMDPPVGPGPEDLAAALAAQTGTESTDPVPVEIDGFAGVYLDYRNTGGGECSTFVRWVTSGGQREALVNERDRVWILDVDGTRLVIDAFSFGGTSDADLEEIRTMIESLDIEPSSGS